MSWLPGHPPSTLPSAKRQWLVEFVAGYSCGGSAGLEPTSRFNVYLGYRAGHHLSIGSYPRRIAAMLAHTLQPV